MRVVVLVLLIISLISLFVKCKSIEKTHLCKQKHFDLKYEVVKHGFIGKNIDTYRDLCLKNYKERYIGLSEECIIFLLGNPAEKKGNKLLYYLGRAETEMVTGKIRFTFRFKKVVKIDCSIV